MKKGVFCSISLSKHPKVFLSMILTLIKTSKMSGQCHFVFLLLSWLSSVAPSRRAFNMTTKKTLLHNDHNQGRVKLEHELIKVKLGIRLSSPVHVIERLLRLPHKVNAGVYPLKA